jgi:hypothetical protein
MRGQSAFPYDVTAHAKTGEKRMRKWENWEWIPKLMKAYAEARSVMEARKLEGRSELLPDDLERAIRKAQLCEREAEGKQKHRIFPLRNVSGKRKKDRARRGAAKERTVAGAWKGGEASKARGRAGRVAKGTVERKLTVQGWEGPKLQLERLEAIQLQLNWMQRRLDRELVWMRKQLKRNGR